MKNHRGWLLAMASQVLVSTLLAGAIPARGAVTTYYFSTSGDDHNDGRSPERALRSLAAIPRLASPGSEILLRRGDVWHDPLLIWDLRGKSGTADAPIRIGAYGDEKLPPPVIEKLAEIERSSWTSEEHGAFSARVEVPSGMGSRLRAYAAGAPMRRVFGRAALGTGEFRLLADRIEFVPPVEAISAIEFEFGPAEPLVLAADTRWLAIEDLDLRGGTNWKAARIEGHNPEFTLARTRMQSPAPPVVHGEPTTRLSPGTYYLSSIHGSTSGDGSIGNPWLSVGKIADWIAPGVTILLERGSVWHDPTLVWNFSFLGATSSTPMRIGAYGSGSDPRPVVAKLVLNLPGDWQSTSVSNRFKTPEYFGGTEDLVFRLYVGGSPLPKVPDQASLVDDSYCVDNGWIYVQVAGATSAPTVESNQYESGFFMFGFGTDYLTIEDLEITGGDGYAGFIFPPPSQSLTLRNLYLHQLWGGGISISRGFPPSAVNQHVDVTIEGCTVDRGWTTAMNSEYAHTVHGFSNGAAGGQPGADGINFSDAVDGGVIRGCTATNFGHSAIGVEYGDATMTSPGVRNVIIEQNVLTSGASSYCRGLASGGPAIPMNLIIRRNYVHDATIQSQIGGDSVYCYSNIFDSTHLGSIPTYQWAAASLGYFVNYGTSAISAAVMHHCVFANNTFDNANYHFFMTGQPDDGTLAYGDSFSNNLLTNWRPFEECYQCPPYNVALKADTTFQNSFNYQNNGFWDESSDKVFQVRRYPAVDSYTVAAFNARTNAENNQFGSPAYVGGSGPGKFQLSSSSPYRSGGIPLSQLLPQGVDPVDFNGNTFLSNPSLGAFQYGWTALTAVAISGAPSLPISHGTAIQLSATPTPSNAEIQTYAWEIKKDGVSLQTGPASTFSYTPTVNGTYTVTLTATDFLGHAVDASTVTVLVWPPPSIVATIDLGGGQIGVLDADGMSVHQDVTVTITNAVSWSVTRNGLAYSFSGGLLTDEGAFEFTAIGTSTAQFGFTIDKTAPVVSGVTNGASYNVNKNPTFNEGAATLNGSAFTSGATVVAEGSYTLVVTDAANNVTTVSFTIDKTAPVVSGVTNGTTYASDRNPTFNEGSATLDGSAFSSGGTVSSEQTHTLVVTDAAGNHTTVSFTIDKTAPVVSGVTNGSYYNTNRNPTFNEGTATLNGSAFTTGGTVSAEGSYTLVVTDVVNHVTTVTFTIDKTAPVITGEYKQGNSWVAFSSGSTLNNKTLRFGWTETNHASHSLVRNGTALTWTGTSENFSTNGTYTATVTDLAGNQTTFTATRN